MKRYWEIARARIDDMSLRERALIFAAAGFVVISLINAMLLDPLMAEQKVLSAQVIQQQEKMKELQAAIQTLLQARRDNENSPLRTRTAQLKQQLQDLDGYMQNRRSRLVEPDKMADLLKQVLGKNGRLQLVALKTLPVSLLIENPQAANGAGQSAATANANDGQKQPDAKNQIFKHGVQISVRGGYAELLRYVSALEKMPAQMYWGEASLNVEQYPYSVLTLTLYTLSMDKTWLTV
ncbi:MAG: agglutinin biogenesis protein [Gallionellales bacterium RIFCSPLOWO2_02_FULL_57_47]|nr:MAG: agglutinin biogenesis protein [Gallionellales bacterium RIFCSPLOWO2_02_FULL_57_47]OGT17115.1 MAG: agglutinin biogenesis protein [Gallionellales bacterium RIFCSPHIGHO2_02_FULL_57_16]